MSVAALVMSMATGVAASASADSLSGAGSTLVQPLEARWAAGFKSESGNIVRFVGVGSASGIADITHGRVDFGASEAPLNARQRAACNTCVQIPWALSATAVGFHLGGITQLDLTGPVLAEIYLGRITKWNDPAIEKLNAHIMLPDEKIIVIYASNGSGDTYPFTNYLSHVSRAWARKVGTGETARFPTGVSVRGNSGVTTALANTAGGIGYIAASYAIEQGLGVAAIRNAAGRYEVPNLANISSAAASVTSVPSDNSISLVDPPKSAELAYPIATYTYVIVPTNTNKAALLRSWISYALTTGQEFGPTLDFAPLPAPVQTAATNTLDSLP